MYDKYNSVSPITVGTTKLNPHKGILVVPQGASTPVMQAWLRNTSAGSTISVGFTFGSATTLGPQILPIELYSINSLSGACAFILN
jgi:hypothetical protein